MEPAQAIVSRRQLARASLTRDDEIIYLQSVLNIFPYSNLYQVSKCPLKEEVAISNRSPDSRPPRLREHAAEHEPDAPRQGSRRRSRQDAQGGQGEDEGPGGPRHHRAVCTGHPQQHQTMRDTPPRCKSHLLSLGNYIVVE